MTDFDVEIAVVGAGGAGTMAYLRAVLNGDRSALFLGDAETRRKGRATWVAEVDNMPGMHELKRPITSTGRTTLEWIDKQPEIAAKGRIIKGPVREIQRVDGGFRLGYEDKEGGGSLSARFVIIATGIMDVQPEIGGSIKPILPFANRYDVLYCIRCDGHKTMGKPLSVIGNTSTAIYIGAMLQERYGHEGVAILSNGLDEDFSDEARELAAAYGMSIHSAPIAAILGDAKGEGLEGYRLDDGSEVATRVSVVSLGIIPYNDLLKQVGAELAPAGRAKLSEKYESSVPGLFVVGDLVHGHKMQIYTAWDEAVDAADEINRRLRMERREAILARHRGSA